MFKGIVMQVFEKSLTVCDLYSLREFFVETNNMPKFSPGDKVYVKYSRAEGDAAVHDQVVTDVFKVDRW